jgi:hypothetical protein
MFEAFALLVGQKSLSSHWARENSPVVPEPEFMPFRFPELSSKPAPLPLAPRTLEELGVPGAVAKEMELYLYLHFRTEGDRVFGYTFRTTDGVSHSLRLSSIPAEVSAERAA